MPPPPSNPAAWPAILRATALGLIAGLGSAIACLIAAGPNLGAFLGPLVFAAILVPFLTLACPGLWQRFFALAAFIDGIALVWLWLMLTTPTTFAQWLQCYATLAAFAAAVAGLTALLVWMRLPPIPAAAIAKLLGLTWLTWPLWLAPYLPGHETLVAALIYAHPLFAINGALIQLGPWAQYNIAYALTNIGDDIPYSMPVTIWPCVGAHALVGLLSMVSPSANSQQDAHSSSR